MLHRARNERISLALKNSGKSISDLAIKLDRAQPTISERLKTEKGTDSISLVQAVAEITGYSFTWLAFGTEDSGPAVSEPATPYGDCYKQLAECRGDLIRCMKEKEQLQEDLTVLKNFIPDSSGESQLKKKRDDVSE
jgi:transcriptional regulator with XRE-family HTH domain